MIVYYSTRAFDPKFNLQLKRSCVLPTTKIQYFENNGVKSLPECYNEALDNSDDDLIVFIHDDVFLERGWDRKIQNYLKKSDYGIIGVAGTSDIENGVWWNKANKMIGQVYHHHNNAWYISKYSKSFKNKILPAVCVDGLFIAVAKSRIHAKFNEQFKGFHFYDIPFCIDNYISDVKVGVVTDIKIKHMSIGEVDESWHEGRKLFEEIYEDRLPQYVAPNLTCDELNPKIKGKYKVSIIIPTKDNLSLLGECLLSLTKTKYENYEIIVADTGSTPEVIDNTRHLISELNTNIKLLTYDYYNFAKINNDVVKNHISKDSELLLFCNDDIVMLNDVISQMVFTYSKQRKKVGTIGCRLHYKNGMIQHGGVIAFHNGQHASVTHEGINTYYGADEHTKTVFGNTAAFMMTRRNIFEEIGGFDERTKECFEDVIYNIDCIIRNLKNIYIGEGACYHYESVTRGRDNDKNQREADDMVNILIPKMRKHFKKILPFFKVSKNAKNK